MSVPRGLGKGGVLVGVLLGVLLSQNRAEARLTTPPKVSLQKALILLDTCKGPRLPEAVFQVRVAIGSLVHFRLFVRGTAPGNGFHPPLAPIPKIKPIAKFILEPPGGLYVLYNRTKVLLAFKDLLAAERILIPKTIFHINDKVRRSYDTALYHTRIAITDVLGFLRTPLLF